VGVTTIAPAPDSGTLARLFDKTPELSTNLPEYVREIMDGKHDPKVPENENLSVVLVIQQSEEAAEPQSGTGAVQKA
jgi:excinuclease UvrABC ATPase subunit